VTQLRLNTFTPMAQAFAPIAQKFVWKRRLEVGVGRTGGQISRILTLPG
jgi:hypothetical protein